MYNKQHGIEATSVVPSILIILQHAHSVERMNKTMPIFCEEYVTHQGSGQAIAPLLSDSALSRYRSYKLLL